TRSAPAVPASPNAPVWGERAPMARTLLLLETKMQRLPGSASGSSGVPLHPAGGCSFRWMMWRVGAVLSGMLKEIEAWVALKKEPPLGGPSAAQMPFSVAPLGRVPPAVQGSPFSPSAPSSPAGPGGPAGPLAPDVPGVPAGPVSPLAPAVPGAPAAPAGPCWLWRALRTLGLIWLVEVIM